MHSLSKVSCVAVVAFVVVSTTARSDDDPATRLAADLREYLSDAKVQSIEFRKNEQAAPHKQLTKPDEIASLVKSFVEATTTDDMREGKQFHRPSRMVQIRFVIDDGPDVRLKSVGMDMFWATKSDDEPAWKQQGVNLQSPALTKCFRKFLSDQQ